MHKSLFLLFLALSFQFSSAQKKEFSYLDIFDLQYASDPQISPNGEWVVYRRMGFDIMKDGSRGNLWLIRSDGTEPKTYGIGK